MTTPVEIASVPVDAQVSLRNVDHGLNPIIAQETLAGPAQSTTHDLVSDSAKTLDIKSYAENWRHIMKITIDKSSKGLLFSQNVDLIYLINTMGLPGWNSTDNKRLARGVKFDVQFKFTVYSFNQQQGAVIMGTCPFAYKNEDLTALFYPILDFSKDPHKPTYMLNDNDLYTQMNHKIISFGGESEVIITVPFMSTRDFYTERSDFLGWVFLSMFDPLVTVEGAFDTCDIVVEARLINYQLFGTAVTDNPIDLGSYRTGIYQ